MGANGEGGRGLQGLEVRTGHWRGSRTPVPGRTKGRGSEQDDDDEGIAGVERFQETGVE
jgi:hypothetical protein